MFLPRGRTLQKLWCCVCICRYVHIGESHRGYLGTGSVDFGALFRALAAADYEGPLTFESFSSAVVSPSLSNTLCVWRNLCAVPPPPGLNRPLCFRHLVRHTHCVLQRCLIYPYKRQQRPPTSDTIALWLIVLMIYKERLCLFIYSNTHSESIVVFSLNPGSGLSRSSLTCTGRNNYPVGQISISMQVGGPGGPCKQRACLHPRHVGRCA